MKCYLPPTRSNGKMCSHNRMGRPAVEHSLHQWKINYLTLKATLKKWLKNKQTKVTIKFLRVVSFKIVQAILSLS